MSMAAPEVKCIYKCKLFGLTLVFIILALMIAVFITDNNVPLIALNNNLNYSLNPTVAGQVIDYDIAPGSLVGIVYTEAPIISGREFLERNSNLKSVHKFDSSNQKFLTYLNQGNGVFFGDDFNISIGEPIVVEAFDSAVDVRVSMINGIFADSITFSLNKGVNYIGLGINTLEEEIEIDNLDLSNIISIGEVDSFSTNPVSVDLESLKYFGVYVVNAKEDGFLTVDPLSSVKYNNIYRYTLPENELTGIVYLQENEVSAYDFLEKYESIVEIQKFDNDLQQYITAAKVFGSPSGTNFSIAKGTPLFIRSNDLLVLKFLNKQKTLPGTIIFESGLSLFGLPYQLPDGEQIYLSNLDLINVLEFYKFEDGEFVKLYDRGKYYVEDDLLEPYQVYSILTDSAKELEIVTSSETSLDLETLAIDGETGDSTTDNSMSPTDENAVIINYELNAEEFTFVVYTSDESTTSYEMLNNYSFLTTVSYFNEETQVQGSAVRVFDTAAGENFEVLKGDLLLIESSEDANLVFVNDFNISSISYSLDANRLKYLGLPLNLASGEKIYLSNSDLTNVLEVFALRDGEFVKLYDGKFLVEDDSLKAYSGITVKASADVLIEFSGATESSIADYLDSDGDEIDDSTDEGDDVDDTTGIEDDTTGDDTDDEDDSTPDDTDTTTTSGGSSGGGGGSGVIVIDTGPYCRDFDTTNTLTLAKARDIAGGSNCLANGGSLGSIEPCNFEPGKIWINIDGISRENCRPACLVDINTKTASFIWNCLEDLTPDEPDLIDVPVDDTPKSYDVSFENVTDSYYFDNLVELTKVQPTIKPGFRVVSIDSVVSRELRPNDSVKFTIGSTSYTLTITRISDITSFMKLEPSGQIIDVDVGSGTAIDLDSDGNDDLVIRMLGVFGGKADIRIISLGIEEEEEIVIPTKTTKATVDTSTRASAGFDLSILFIPLVLIIAGVAYYFFVYKKEEEQIEEEKIVVVPKQFERKPPPREIKRDRVSHIMDQISKREEKEFSKTAPKLTYDPAIKKEMDFLEEDLKPKKITKKQVEKVAEKKDISIKLHDLVEKAEKEKAEKERLKKILGKLKKKE